jgi:carboxyl-terminal processing protease
MHQGKFDRDLFLETLKKYSYFKDCVDWDDFKRELFSSKEITLKGINNLLKKVDKHSFVVISSAVREKKFPQDLSKIETRDIQEKIGYLKLDGFFVPDNDKDAYKKNYNDIVSGLNSIKNSQYLIIDLTENTGGNIYPWFAALTPLFDTKTVGYFEYKYKEKKDGWILNPDGVYCGDKKWFEEINQSKYFFQKIAVLISSKTSSSGEALAIAFKGQSNAKLFGQPTAGFTTGNEKYENGDFIIWLSTCVMQDRDQISYESGLGPDIKSTTPIDDAKPWLTLTL